MTAAIGVFAILMGLGIAGIWTADILRNPDIDLSDGLVGARDKDSGTIFWLHWLAEYSTAALLLLGGAAMLLDLSWATQATLVGLGALGYTSINSLGWAFARPERYVYGVPMVLGATGAVVSAAWLVVAA